MTRRPDAAAVITVAFLAADAGLALVLDAPWPAAVLGVMAVTAAALFWHVPEEDDDDLQALIEATREEIPDHVPAEWTGENT